MFMMNLGDRCQEIVFTVILFRSVMLNKCAAVKSLEGALLLMCVINPCKVVGEASRRER